MAAGKEVEEVNNRHCRLCHYGVDAIFDRSDEDNDAKNMGSLRHFGDSKGNVPRFLAFGIPN